MSKIRKLYYFDKKSTEELISLLNNSAGDSYINHIMFNPLILLHHLLPLRFKFLPESFVLKDENEIKCLITIAPVKSNHDRVEIQKLLFEENSLADAAELVQYAVSRYKAMGAASVIVKVDDYLPELISMFTERCGFSQISSEKLWRVDKFIETPYDKKEFRDFKNSDADCIANAYNDMLLPHFRPLLSKTGFEFQEGIFKGLVYCSEYRYIIEDLNTQNITGSVSFQTTDNENYVVDIISAGGIEIDVNSVLHFVSDEIKKRKNRFGLFIKSKKYTNISDKLEEKFMQNGFECVQSRMVLTNSSARVLKNPEKSGRYTILNNFIPTNGIPT